MVKRGRGGVDFGDSRGRRIGGGGGSLREGVLRMLGGVRWF